MTVSGAHGAQGGSGSDGGTVVLSVGNGKMDVRLS
jgi:hypothetical protein